MRWSIIRLIWLRELRDQLRDRRTLFMIAVLPLLLYPVLGIGVLQFALGFSDQKSIIGIERGPRHTSDFPEEPAPAISYHLAWLTIVPQPGSGPEIAAAAAALAQAETWVPRYPLLFRNGKLSLAPGPNRALVKYLENKIKFVFLNPDDSTDALENRNVHLIARAGPDFYAALWRGEFQDRDDGPALKIVGDLDDDRFRQAKQRLVPLLDIWKKDLKAVRFAHARLPPRFDEPFVLQEPPPTKQGGGTDSLLDLVIRIFPFMLVMWSLAGALYPAVDLCAGEKERGTMETLLISPAGREEIVLGKFLTIWVFSGGTALLNLVSMGLTTWQFANQLPFGSLPLMSLAWCLVLLLPLSAFFSAICLAVGAYARSSKEGQYYLMPLFLITMPLIFLTLAPGVKLSPFYSLVPVTGAALLMQELMTAGSLDKVPWLYFIPVLAPIVLYSILALRWAIDQFQREEVLFREAERLDMGLWLKRLFREKEETPSTGQAFFLFGLLLVLSWLALSLGKNMSIVVHNTIRQLAFVATPALMMALLLNTRPMLGLKLKWPRLHEIGLAAILAVLLLPPLAALTEIVFSQYPHLTRLLEDRQPLMQELRALSEGRQLRQDQVIPYVLVFALLPALCEEIAFRGFILSGLLKHFRPRTAVLLSSFLFALFHMNVFQFLPAFFLGVVLGLLTVRSRSLVPAVMFHLLHNSVLIGGIHLVANLEDAVPPFVKQLWYPFIAICFLAALALLWWLYRKPYVELEKELAAQREKVTMSS